ncbi:hypothetical protein BC830DRAFT_1260688 [Chytriomyces sp. MP71]|nr:hypothetical protein BC830DRAFT_1260688 [Chytriomyces sp. MP71]
MGRRRRQGFVPLPVDDPRHPNQTPFRVYERAYKRKTDGSHAHQPTLVLSLPPLEKLDRLDNLEVRRKAESEPTSGSRQPLRALLFPSHPGLIVLPAALDEAEQRAILRTCLRGWTGRPNVSNLDTHYVVHEPRGLWALHEREWRERQAGRNIDSIIERRVGGSEDMEANGYDIPPRIDPPTTNTPLLQPLPVSQLIKRWRWSSLGWQYNWTEKIYHMDRPVAFPKDLHALTRSVVGSVESITQYPGNAFSSEAGIINFYQLNDALMGHQDRSEINMDAPLVSYSLGHSCIFLIGSESREDEEKLPLALVLRSGDIVVMSGASRRCFHGVPRILAGTLPPHLRIDAGSDEEEDWRVFGSFLEEGARVNVNVRQII